MEPLDEHQVSIHALLAECDYFRRGIRLHPISFQSTHSLRSATRLPVIRVPLVRVSIHALLAECDWCRPRGCDLFWKFQSTHSLRSATLRVGRRRNGVCVSIHALLAECDAASLTMTPQHICFNPRTPCGVRLLIACARVLAICFNPRTPCGVRLPWAVAPALEDLVSIHALLAECDCTLLCHHPYPGSFNPRTPCGVRPQR